MWKARKKKELPHQQGPSVMAYDQCSIWSSSCQIQCNQPNVTHPWLPQKTCNVVNDEENKDLNFIFTSQENICVLSRFYCKNKFTGHFMLH